MRLEQLLSDSAIGFRSEASPSLEVTGIADDSRRVRSGDLFIARKGVKISGAKFAADAVAKGAVAVVSEEALPPDLGVPRIVVSDAIDATAKLAHAFYGFPARSLKIAAVTGTNGKTTVAYLLRHILNRAGIKCGLFGTVEIDDGTTCTESDNTTPGAIEIARSMAAMRDHDCKAVAMEASSHALHQGRMNELPIAVAGFTNLTGDHLDYHGTMDDYAAAKAKLFADQSADGVAVINADDAMADRMARDCPGRIVRYAITADGHDPQVDCDGFAEKVVVDSLGTRFEMRSGEGVTKFDMPLIGKHNVQNALTAAACGSIRSRIPCAMRPAPRDDCNASTIAASRGSVFSSTMHTPMTRSRTC
jgi:UDP-N-acetylmuramoyl-L-alanyl-D-glutamate--2,6-diaminopimelate ligase